MLPLDEEKYKRLKQTLELGYEITRLYALYLERCPEAITKQMIDEVTSDGSMTKEVALVAILSSMFGIDPDRGIRDRRLLREYLMPSIRILDPKRYTENPYYKNINIPNVKDGAWELRQESYKPYRGVICGDMEISEDLCEVPPLGFFEEEFFFPAVLEDGNEWMTLTPVDLDTCEEAINKARGKVITFGLGLGYFAYMTARKENVKSVTVIEKSGDVIALFKKHILPQFPFADKIRIINADAFEYAEVQMPKEKFDYAFVDTWRDASDGAPMYERMKALEHLSGNTEFDYWIEGFLVSALRSARLEKMEKARMLGTPGAPSCYNEALHILKNPLDC